MHGKATEIAIAAMGYLAERFASGENVSAVDIADARGLPRPYVSKVLTELARADLVTGVRGPGGGFRLAREPDGIYLYEAYELFERSTGDACPFGGGICGQGKKCPLHDMFAKVRAAEDEILRKTTFGVFVQKRKRA